MILTMAFTLALNVAGAAAEQQPAPQTDAVIVAPDTRFATHNVVIGVGGHESENNSSKFLEYRSYPNGAVLPYLRFFGNGKLLYDVSARNAFQDDAWYGLRLEKGGFALRGEVVRIPHGFGNGAVSVLQDLGNGAFRIDHRACHSWPAADADEHDPGAGADHGQHCGQRHPGGELCADQQRRWSFDTGLDHGFVLGNRDRAPGDDQRGAVP